MNCYLCKSQEFKVRDGSVRDNPKIKVLECLTCGLVQLNSQDHLKEGHYESSRMHGKNPPEIEEMLRASSEDDERRFHNLRRILVNKRVLDFGCGNGGFLKKAQELASAVSGVEPEQRVQKHYQSKIQIFPDLNAAKGGLYDLITAFHVIEHLPDPVKTLVEMQGLLTKNGRIIIEVPSSSDILLTLFACKAFQNFTYWSQHLYLFNTQTLRILIEEAGYKVLSIEQYQRYPLSNHLYWLSQGKPGGHNNWSFIDAHELDSAYKNNLAKIGSCDTLIAHLELPK